jgi:hypothetical protein
MTSRFCSSSDELQELQISYFPNRYELLPEGIPWKFRDLMGFGGRMTTMNPKTIHNYPMFVESHVC